MKKKVLAGIMMAVMMMASVMCVSAAESKSDEVNSTGDSLKGYETDLVFDGVEDSVVATIKELNADKITSLSADIQKKLDGKSLVAEVFDLQTVEGSDHTACATTGHKVTLKVTSLTEKCSDVVILHYSKKAGAWEVIEPISVDYKNGTVTAIFKDLSPVAIYAKVATSGSTGTSPSTVGTSSTWMLLAAVAIVALGAGVVATQKRSR